MRDYEDPPTTTYVQAETANGKLRGVQKRGVLVFKGIHYGASTADEHRFMPPRPPVAWSGVRDALDYGDSAPQAGIDPGGGRSTGSGGLIGRLNDHNESEDCLVLNVWTPALSDNAKRPVMVWLHGGGFQAGTGSSPGYDGTHLVKRGDVVVVTLNHRLNAFGFTHLAELGGEPFAHSGNVGMLDLVLALRWVRDNIEQFGGDPGCVTIFGESGGGRKVGTLLGMPAAKGLFHRAIIQSGPTLRVVNKERATFAAQALLDELQVSKANFRQLQSVSMVQLQRAFAAASRRHRFNHIVTGFAPVVDGDVLPHDPFHPNASPLMGDVPLIAGTNRSELTLMLAGDQKAFALSDTELRERVQAQLGENASRVIEVYREAVPDASPSQLYFLIVSDHAYCARMMALAERRAALGRGPVFFYYFSWETPVQGGRLMSPHALEIPFVFDNTQGAAALTGGGPRAAALADKVSDAWIAFARTGSPDTPKLPPWPRYEAPSRQTMVLDDASAVVSDPTAERRRVMQEVLGLASQ